MIVWPILGIVLLLLLAADVFVTVFHPQGHGGPVNRTQNRLVWTLFRTLGVRGDGSMRRGWLALAGPLLAVLTPTGWVLLLVAGYALIFYPWIHDFLVSPGHLRVGWAEALYYSGYTAATLGFGDVIADAVPLRLLTVTEALSGFALLSASLTYVLSVYQEHGRMTTLAMQIDSRLPPPAGASARSPSHAASWGEWMTDTSGSLLHVQQAHARYPILHFFWSSQRGMALPVQVGALLGLRRELEECGGDGDSAPGYQPGLHSLGCALDGYLTEVDRHFVPDGFEPDRAENVQQDAEAVQRRLLRYMRYA